MAEEAKIMGYADEEKLNFIRRKALQVAEESIVRYNAINVVRKKNGLDPHMDLQDRVVRLNEIATQIRSGKKVPFTTWIPHLIVLVGIPWTTLLVGVVDVTKNKKEAVGGKVVSVPDSAPLSVPTALTVAGVLYLIFLLMVRNKAQNAVVKTLIGFYNGKLNEEQAKKTLEDGERKLNIRTSKLLVKVKENVSRRNDGVYRVEI